MWSRVCHVRHILTGSRKGLWWSSRTTGYSAHSGHVPVHGPRTRDWRARRSWSHQCAGRSCKVRLRWRRWWRWWRCANVGKCRLWTCELLQSLEKCVCKLLLIHLNLLLLSLLGGGIVGCCLPLKLTLSQLSMYGLRSLGSLLMLERLWLLILLLILLLVLLLLKLSLRAHHVIVILRPRVSLAHSPARSVIHGYCYCCCCWCFSSRIVTLFFEFRQERNRARLGIRGRSATTSNESKS